MFMRNNKGFIKFEVLTIFVLAIGALAYGLYFILGSTGKQKYDTFKDSAVTFAKVVSTNSNTFHNSEVIYLNEVVDEKLLKSSIKNPFGSGNCDESESKVEYDNGKFYVSLKCGDYYIDKSSTNNKKLMHIYTVGKWNENKISGDDVETKTLYNCVDSNGKEIFDNYVEELYMISKLNKEFESDYYFAPDVTDCTVVTKEMYREKKLLDKSN